MVHAAVGHNNPPKLKRHYEIKLVLTKTPEVSLVQQQKQHAILNPKP
jgi:hypothetical protein